MHGHGRQGASDFFFFVFSASAVFDEKSSMDLVRNVECGVRNLLDGKASLPDK